jgi:ABC-type sugar transport system permease subunit
MLEGTPISAAATRESTRQSVGRLSGVRRVARSESLLFLLFVAPNLILFGIFTYWPLVYSGYLSLTRWDMISPKKTWVGLSNYSFLLRDDSFQTVLKNTFVFTGGAVGGSLFLGLLIALLLNQPLRMRDGARAVVFAPTLLSGAAISIVWVYIFDPRYGLMRQVLDPFGIPSPTWLRDPTWAMVAVIIVYIWKNVGFAAVIFLAGLQTIPKDLYEAAKVDGAGAFNRFRNVTLPMLSPISLERKVH